MSTTKIKAKIESFTNVLDDGRDEMDDDQINYFEERIKKLSGMTDEDLESENDMRAEQHFFTQTGRKRTQADKEILEELSTVSGKYDFVIEPLSDKHKLCPFVIYVLKKGDDSKLRVMIGTGGS